MRQFKGLMAGRFASDLLDAQSDGKVHSVFERTFNILFNNGLVGITRSDVPLSPMDLRTDISPPEKMPELGIKKGLRVKVSGDFVSVGDVLHIDLAEMGVWRPPNRVKDPVGPTQVKKALSKVEEVALARSRSDGLGQLLPYLDSILNLEAPHLVAVNDVSQAALPPLVDLVRATTEGDIHGIKTAVNKLIGLGPGLTPSADDLLIGYISAIHWVSQSFDKRDDFFRKINEAIIFPAEATTLLSSQLLRLAAHGEVNEVLVNLYQALLSGELSNLDVLISDLTKFGGTSGMDTLVGLLLGIKITLKKILR
ncbi:MAG: DUF2877 domain-containing protein [Candidatus Hadarchaeum sp.]